MASGTADLAASHAAGRVGVGLRHQLLEHALRRPNRAESDHSVGELSLLATRGVVATEPYFTRYLPALVLALLLPPLTVLAIASQDLWSAVIVICTLPLIPIFAVLIGLATRDRADRQWRTLNQLAGYFLDVVKGLPTLVAYRRARPQIHRIKAITDQYRRTTLDTLRIAFVSSAALELIATISVALVAVTVGLRLAHGNLDFATALIVLLLAPEAYWPLRRVGAEFHAAAEGTTTFEQIRKVLDQSSGDRPSTPPRQGVHDGLELRGVCFSYGDNQILSDVTAYLPSTGLTVITGPSGCGKSTLLEILSGELAPDHGSVTAAGVQPGQDDWPHQVAHVGQRPWIKSGTVADNVRIGSPMATPEQVREALDRVGLGLQPDAQVGEDGRLLSAGQRARLALARVVISSRPWVILDEPTAHLDQKTEESLLQTLRELATERAVITVAHRPALIEAADLTLPLPPRNHEPVGNQAPTSPTASSTPVAELVPSPEPGRNLTRAKSLLGGFLATMASSFGVALTATAGWLIARAAEQPPILYLMVAIVSVRMFGLGRPAWSYAERLVTHDSALRQLAAYRASVYEVLIPLTPARLGLRRGDLLASIVDDVDALVDHQLRVRQPVIAWLGTTALAIAVAVLVWLPAAWLVGIASLVGGTLVWLIARMAASRTEPIKVAARAELSAAVVETLTHAPSLRLWNQEEVAVSAVDLLGRKAARASDQTNVGLASARALALVVGAMGAIGIAFGGATALVDNTLSAPMLALLIMIPIALVDVLSPLADAGSLSVHTTAARNRVSDLERAQPAVTDPSVSRGSTGPASIRLDEVGTGWDQTTVINGLSLNIPPGRHLGVVGPSGCGKSTLAALLLRFLPTHSGSYLLGEQDVVDLTGDEVRRRIGLVDDDPHVFASNVAENIRLARPGATDAELVAALGAAHLNLWINELPAGLDTRIGEGGVQVSGGERARIGLARAILADPPVLVLDEPTAHLDTATAQGVTDDLLRASTTKSLVWITHTEVGLDQMDQVLEMNDPAGLPESLAGSVLVRPR
ncbi:MAG TPA: thiol reductant ABC exporter subunit CydD, partial [Marmoricola sp.]|nr:thiol reductant ABC exporter subunit CydD [Marmoricola sp.]